MAPDAATKGDGRGSLRERLKQQLTRNQDDGLPSIGSSKQEEYKKSTAKVLNQHDSGVIVINNNQGVEKATALQAQRQTSRATLMGAKSEDAPGEAGATPRTEVEVHDVDAACYNFVGTEKSPLTSHRPGGGQ